MRSEFASGRPQLPFTTSNVAITSGGTTTTSHTLYLTLQGENQIGLNLQSAIAGPFTVNPGQQLVVSIPTSTKLAGEAWQSFVLSASATGSKDRFVQLAKLPGSISLPATIILSNDDAFALSRVVPTAAALPATPVNGQLRGVSDLSYVYEYDANSGLFANSTTVLAHQVGRWIQRGAVFATYVDDVKEIGGCSQDVRDIDESQVKIPKYACDRSPGTVTKFWLRNENSSPEPAGKRVGLVVQLNGVTKTQAFHGLLRLVFRGYANTATGELRTTGSDGNEMAGVDQEVRFQANKTNLVLEDNLQPGEAYVIDVVPSFDAADLSHQIPGNAVISVYPFLYTQAGTYSEAGAVIGDVIYAEGDRRLIVPGLGLTARALSGSGMVDSFSFLNVAEVNVFGLVANTANQAIAIDHDGDVAVRDLPVASIEVVRAIVSTVDGIGNPGDWSTAVAVAAGSELTVTCNYPCTADGIGIVRPNYPDNKIAGISRGLFNPTRVVLYLKRLSDGEIRQFVGNAVIPGTSQSFSIESWANGTTVPSLNTNPDTAFGLFAPQNCTVASEPSSTDLVAASYQAAYSFEYQNAVTGITHDESNGCIFTSDTSLAGIASRSHYWAEAVYTVDDLRRVPAAERSPYQNRIVLQTASGQQQYNFNPNKLETDDNDYCIKPLDVADSQPGRWEPINKGPTTKSDDIVKTFVHFG